MLFIRLLGVTCKHCLTPYLCKNKGIKKQKKKKSFFSVFYYEQVLKSHNPQTIKDFLMR